MRLTLHREKSTPERTDCTLGFLFITDKDGREHQFCTMERPWVPSATNDGGAKGKSCVPLGLYKLVPHNSPKHPFTWALVNHDLDVVHFEGDDRDPDEDRTTCVLHPGNYARDSKGCILPGLAHAFSNSEHMVTSSVRAMDRIRALVPWTDEHTLEIK